VADLLFLTHRLPYPPNKGDKVRSYHLLKHLAVRHRVFLGTFIDDPADEAHVATVRSLCADVHVARLNPTFAKVRSLCGLVSGSALTVPYYRDAGLRAWVARTLGGNAIRTAVVFSSAMAQYVDGFKDLRLVIDFVDVDSAKWAEYARSHGWPRSWIYRREGNRLLEFERRMAARSSAALFVTEAEAALFRALAPECSDKIASIGNGVDANFFSPEVEHASPYSAAETPIVFTGAMDYWPNIDAVCWFASEVLPKLRIQRPDLRLYVVGMKPAPPVEALNGDAVTVTGTVPDVRPYLRHAAVVVAPLRVARGIQNKVLEAMAMARPIVASRACVAPIDGLTRHELATAAEPSEYVSRIDALLRQPAVAAAMGGAAREFVVSRYSWAAQLARLDRFVQSSADFHGTGVLQPVAHA
jgi:sugar transferase (PEP-CTERM/EpsH1 system associated)